LAGKAQIRREAVRPAPASRGVWSTPAAEADP
jgi:hypothetical protein